MVNYLVQRPFFADIILAQAKPFVKSQPPVPGAAGAVHAPRRVVA